MKRNENFWSYLLHKLGTPKVLRTDRRTDRRSRPTTRPAFAKATQVRRWTETPWRAHAGTFQRNTIQFARAKNINTAHQWLCRDRAQSQVIILPFIIIYCSVHFMLYSHVTRFMDNSVFIKPWHPFLHIYSSSMLWHHKVYK